MSMPKASKLGDASILVEAAPMSIEREDDAGPLGADPMKPQFPPLNAFDQNGKKIEFRKVSFSSQSTNFASLICFKMNTFLR